MRRKKFRVELLLCHVFMALVLFALLGCTVFLGVNVYVIYTGNRGGSAATEALHLQTTTKEIEICKPSTFLCANLR
jgi:hypothetical protein